MSTYRQPGMIKPPDIGNCPGFLYRYLSYLFDNEDMNADTVLSYAISSREFCQYIHYKTRFHRAPSNQQEYRDLDITQMQLHELFQLTGEDIREYLSYMETVAHNSPTTLNKKLTLLRKFFKYLDVNASELGMSFVAGNPTRHVNHLKVTPQKALILSPDQLRKMLSCCTGEIAARDRAIIMLMATCPKLSLEDIVTMRRSDVSSDGVRLRTDSGRVITRPITKTCWETIRGYLMDLDGMDRSYTPPDILFVNPKNGRPLTTRTIQHRIQRTAELAHMGALDITADTLQDTALYMLIKSNPDKSPKKILEYLGCKYPDQIAKRLNIVYDEASFVENDLRELMNQIPQVKM